MRRGKILSLMTTLSVVMALLPALPAIGQLPETDIIFAVDESGSMGDEQAALKDNIKQVANDLSASTDGLYGLVGYGARNFAPVTEQPLTDNLTDFENAVDGLTTNGGTEPGYDATIHALTDPNMGRRATAGTCIVLATDEPSNGDSATQQNAIDTLVAEGAFFFGLLSGTETINSYDDLANATGGAIFSLEDFNNDPANVLSALLTTCVQSIVAGSGSVDVHPTSCPNPFTLGKRGVVPAAILGTDAIDVTEIDPATVKLSGPAEGITASPIRWSIEDVAAPDEFPEPETRDECGTDGPDGFDDLSLKFDAGEFQAVLGEVSVGDTVIVTISAETFEGAPVSGVDIIWINGQASGGNGSAPPSAPPADLPEDADAGPLSTLPDAAGPPGRG